MPAYHDFVCSSCEEVYTDLPTTMDGVKCICRKGVLEIRWSSARSRNASAIGKDEMTVVYEHPVTGRVMYPPRNDQPMPERYAQRGFVRKEMRTLREVEKFSEQRGLVNERVHYDKGSGRSYDTEPGRR